MDDGNIPLIIALVVLVAFSAFFSASETAYTSLNKIRLKNQAKDGNRRAKLALKIANDFDRTLSSLLVGNNIVNIACASLGTILFTNLFGAAGVTISTAVITVVLLIFGEISPKSIAKEYPEKFAMTFAPVLRFLMLILFPINFLFMLWKKLLNKVFHKNENPSITEDELMVIVDEVESEGVIEKHESDLIKSAIEFEDISVREILVPRVDVVACEADDPADEVQKLFEEHGFSRLIVYEDSIDNVLGIIHEKDFYNAYIHDRNISIRSLINGVLYVPETVKISALLKNLQKSKTQIAVVLDQYGGMDGIVSIEDILEELVGEIWDEHDEIITDFHKVGDRKYRIACSSNLYDMMEYLQMDESQCTLQNMSVSRFVMEMLGKIPEVGDQFTWENLRVTVEKTDSRRVLEILVEVMEDKPEEGEKDK